MRMLSVIGAALALAMCLALPAAAAPTNDHLAFDVMAYELAVAPAFDATTMPADPLLDVDAALSTSVADVGTSCSDGPAWVAVPKPGRGYTAERLTPCTGHRHDPGWRSS